MLGRLREETAEQSNQLETRMIVSRTKGVTEGRARERLLDYRRKA